MKIPKKLFIVIVVLFLYVSCNDNDENTIHYNPNTPISFNSFIPDSGGVAAKTILIGSNFGCDPSIVKVYFNEKRASVIGVANEAIHVLVPRQPGTLSNISIVIGKDSVSCKTKQFLYKFSATVLPLAGIVPPDGVTDFKDGSFAEAMFKSPRFIQCDKDDNLFVSDNENRVRLVSQELGYVMTLADNIARPVGGCTSTDGKRIYFSAYVWKNNASDRNVFCFDPDRQWIPVVVPTGIPRDKVDWVSQLAIDENDILYFGAENGNLFAVDIRKGTYRYLKQGATRNGDYVYTAYSQKDRRVYFATRDESRIYYFDLKTDEFKLLAGSTKGHKDGPGGEAQFKIPTQIAVDPDGNLIVADRGNHVIRMVRPDGFTSTLAGIPEKAGYMNGVPEKSLFNEPYGVCVSPTTGVIYVSDSKNFRIRKLIIE